MSSPCTIETCKRKSRALCYCCNKSLCLDHLKEHHDSINSQVNPLVDELNTTSDQLLKINVNDVVKNCRQKLDQWRDDCHIIIDRFYEEKCQELQQRCAEQIDKQQKEIDRMKLKTGELIREQEVTHEDIPSLKATTNDIKGQIKQFEEKGIIVDARPLIIDKSLVYIEEWTSNEVDISTLPSPFRTIDCSDDGWPVLASNNQFLLLDQYPNLYLFDSELTLIKQIPWEYDRIPDTCWSSTLNCFIIITDKDGVFLINENLTSIEPIEAIERKKWLSCTCSDTSLFMTTSGYGSEMFQFNLLSSFRLVNQWNSPESCDPNEFIYNIAYNNETLAVLIQNKSNSSVRMELRSSLTLDRLWSLPLDITHIGGRVHRVCLLKCDEWVVIDHNTSRLLQINKEGKVKLIHGYQPTPYNAVLFNSNKLVIRTANCLNCYRV